VTLWVSSSTAPTGSGRGWRTVTRARHRQCLEAPSWAEAHRRLQREGRRSRIRHPSEAQRRFEISEPRALNLHGRRPQRSIMTVTASGSHETPRWRKADSNHRSRRCERLCWALPVGTSARKPSHLKYRSEIAMIAWDLPAAVPFAVGPRVRIRLPANLSRSTSALSASLQSLGRFPSRPPRARHAHESCPRRQRLCSCTAVRRLRGCSTH
jgi:hypothetical protein